MKFFPILISGIFIWCNFFSVGVNGRAIKKDIKWKHHSKQIHSVENSLEPHPSYDYHYAPSNSKKFNKNVLPRVPSHAEYNKKYRYPIQRKMYSGKTILASQEQDQQNRNSNPNPTKNPSEIIRNTDGKTVMDWFTNGGKEYSRALTDYNNWGSDFDKNWKDLNSWLHDNNLHSNFNDWYKYTNEN